jgi:long-subunit fatty acid transport protein
MGGAFLAVSDDPSAASWNPAGLSRIDKAQMNLSFSSYMGRREYSTTLNSSTFNYGISGELENNVNALSFASIVIPFTLRDRDLVGGILYQRLVDIY